MRVQLVDPPAYTPPYDFALAGALARAGRRRRAAHQPLPLRPHAAGERLPRARGASTAARPPATAACTPRRALRAGRARARACCATAAAGADVVHYQWLTLEALDALLLAARRPARVHLAQRAAPRRRARCASGRRGWWPRRSDAVIAHTEDGARRWSSASAPTRRGCT